MSFLLTALCAAIFVAGLWCYGLAFQIDNDMLQLLTFAGGMVLNAIAFFIPWQLTGHSRK